MFFQCCPSPTPHLTIPSHHRRSRYTRELHAMPWNILIEEVDFSVKNPLLESSHDVRRHSLMSTHKSSMAGLNAEQGRWSVRLGSVGMEAQLGLTFFRCVPAQYQVCTLLTRFIEEGNIMYTACVHEGKCPIKAQAGLCFPSVLLCHWFGWVSNCTPTSGHVTCNR